MPSPHSRLRPVPIHSPGQGYTKENSLQWRQFYVKVSSLGLKGIDTCPDTRIIKDKDPDKDPSTLLPIIWGEDGCPLCPRKDGAGGVTAFPPTDFLGSWVFLGWKLTGHSSGNNSAAIITLPFCSHVQLFQKGGFMDSLFLIRHNRVELC